MATTDLGSVRGMGDTFPMSFRVEIYDVDDSVVALLSWVSSVEEGIEKILEYLTSSDPVHYVDRENIDLKISRDSTDEDIVYVSTGISSYRGRIVNSDINLISVCGKHTKQKGKNNEH